MEQLILMKIGRFFNYKHITLLVLFVWQFFLWNYYNSWLPLDYFLGYSKLLHLDEAWALQGWQITHPTWKKNIFYQITNINYIFFDWNFSFCASKF